MSSWALWTLAQWNERLLKHFFGRRSVDDAPVTTLLATQEELARATGDLSAQPEVVRDVFVDAVLRSVRRESLLDTAVDYYGYPGPPLDDAVPPFVSYLVFTCIAAAESSDELASEGSFVARLRVLSKHQLPESSIHHLPRLWENLAAWLARPDNLARYRPLKLPDPGGLTRIGYTTKLAFPYRRDQRELADLLDREGLLGHEPPVGKVLALVVRERARFFRRFKDAFDEFRQQYAAGAGQDSSRLLDHRFWSAVREAALLGRGRGEDVTLQGRAQLLAEVQDDQLEILVVTDMATDTRDALSSVELPVSYGPWKYALLEKRDAASLDGASIARAANALLALEHRVQPVSAAIEQGVLAFVETNHGLLELASREHLKLAEFALVRKDLEGDLVRICGRATTKVAPTRYKGWVQIYGLDLSPRESEQIEASDLRRVWMLHQSVSRVSVVLTGGIPVEDGWLGLRGLLPRVRAANAATVVLQQEEREHALSRLGNDEWALPDRDFAGACTIELVSKSGEHATRQLRFALAPSLEEFKEPSDRDAWIAEGVGGTYAASQGSPFNARQPADAEHLAERLFYLGANIGEFVDGESRAAWVVTEFAKKRVARRGGQTTTPVEQSSDAGDRRRWKRLLFRSDPDPADAQFIEQRRAVKQFGAGGLPEHEGKTEDVLAAAPSDVPSPPFPEVERLVSAVAARANSKCGLSWQEWSELVQAILRVDPVRVDSITRAWQETGALDVLSSNRWRHRGVFACRPRLATFASGSRIGATLIGLALPSTRASLLRVARRSGAQVEERFSCSPLVAPTLTIRARSISILEEISRATPAPVVFIDHELSRLQGLCTHNVSSSAPVAYQWKTPWTHWSLATHETPAGVTVDHWKRDDRPGYWLVTTHQAQVWSYDLNVARLWATRMTGSEPLISAGDRVLEAHHAYLPLPIARLVSAFAPIVQGPEPAHQWRYRYHFNTSELRAAVQQTLSSAFDVRRLARP